MRDDAALKGEGDRYLIEGILGGDEGAFRQLVDRYGGRLTAYAARRLSGTGVDAEDVVQETFLGLLQSIQKGGERLIQVRSLEAYLFQILRNKAYDIAQKRPEAHGLRKVPLAAEDADGSVDGYDPVAAGGTPSSHARRGEESQLRRRVLADILDELISGLKEEKTFRDLKVLELLFLTTLKGRDIARAAGTSEPTVTRIKQAALERLARLAARHRLGAGGFTLPEGEEDISGLIRSVWRENLLSCLKRSTLGAFALGAIEKDWKDYVAFHLEVVRCETCAANLLDLKSEGTKESIAARERVFQSSIGFLKRAGR
ncbi:MAG: sigma-70 family RNA polymerase sigma factor [Planctomycetes bacterium]|nr:sigma-70 family RNA polymerase sigma factor [Planctomycetota bacterium]